MYVSIIRENTRWQSEILNMQIQGVRKILVPVKLLKLVKVEKRNFVDHICTMYNIFSGSYRFSIYSFVSEIFNEILKLQFYEIKLFETTFQVCNFPL